MITIGNYNTAIGFHALLANINTFGNTAVGYGALSSNINRSFNTAIGDNALSSSTVASYNTAIGIDAGGGLIRGITMFPGCCIGSNGRGFSNSIAIGYMTTCTASNQVRMGDFMINSIGGFTSWTNFSDGAVKKTSRKK